MSTRIAACLWFDNQAEEAAQFYTAIFPNSKITSIARYPEGSPGPVGSVMTVEFELDGRPFTGLNGGPQFKFTEAVSFVVQCNDQGEVDYYWDRLGAGGKPVQCGWLADKFGLSWQIVPTRLAELFAGADAARAQRVMQAMLQMTKLDIAKLERAHADGQRGSGAA